MRGIRACAVLMMCLLVTASMIVLPIINVRADIEFKQVNGQILPNGTVTAWDPVNNGVVYFYIQNRTNEGNGTDPVENIAGFHMYDPAISNDINDWKVDDECIIVVERDYGTYGVDHAGYIAFTNITLASNPPNQPGPTIELQKIPIPTLEVNGTGFINMTWSSLNDPNGLIAGYKIYRSTTNGTDLGDDDWELVGGDVNNPLTDLWFNDTSVIAGEGYHYSVKVVFTGYKNNDTLQKDNYQNQYFGEGSGNWTSPGAPPTVDYILIMTDSGGAGFEIPDQTVNVGETITGYAVAFNYVLGFLWDVSVTWTIIQTPPENATTTPSPGTWSDFWSGWNGGSVVWEADDGTHIDVVNISITAPGVDTIEIVDSPGTGLSPIADDTVDVGYTITGWAAGFNNTIGYFGDVSVTWTVNNLFGANGQTAPGMGTTSMFNASSPDGMAEWTATYMPGITDMVTFTINPPIVDFILIVDAPGGAGSEIADRFLGVNTIVNAWAAAYNNSVGYLYDISVTWTVNLGGGAQSVANPGMGINTTFNAKSVPGTAVLDADAGGGINDTVSFTIMIPTVDYIQVVTTPGTGSIPIVDFTVGVGITINGYAAAFNLSSGYISDVLVNWTVEPFAGENATTTPLMNSDWSDFWSGWIGGMVYWNATDGYGHSYSIIVTIDPPVVNYIEIVDTPNTGAAQIGPQTLGVGVTITGYAAGFNTTIGYFGDVSVTWGITFSGSENATVTPGPSTTSDLWSGWIGGSVDWEAEFGGLTDTVTVTIDPPVVNYIEIVDTPGTGAAEIGTQTLGVGITITGYAAGFNTTIGYFGDVTVEWTAPPSGSENATTTPGTGTWSDLWSGWIGGTVTWTANYNMDQAIDTVTVTIDPPVVNYIEIVDTPGTGMTPISDQTLVTSVTLVGHAAQFNNTIGYFGDVSANWQVIPSATEDAFTNPPSGTSSTFNSGTVAGTVDWEADFGGITDTVTITITPYGTEYIEIVRDQGTGSPLIVDFIVGVGIKVRGYAAAFNSSAPGTGYLGDVIVTWTVTPTFPANSSRSPASGIWTDFYSGFNGGTATWTADDGAGHTDTVTVTIDPPVVNYIEIVETPGTGSPQMGPQTLGVGVTITGYAASFNNTIGYLGDVSANWQVLLSGSENATATPGPSTSSDFWSGWIGGSVDWEAEFGGLTDTVTITIDPVVINYIEIVDTPGTGMTPYDPQSVGVGATITGYAASFNYTIGYQGDVSATWTIIQTPPENATTTSPGTSADFWSGWNAGSVDWEADFGGLTDTVTVTINPPTIDYIRIRDASGNEISGQTVFINTNIWGFAAGFNTTIGFVMNVSADWSVDDLGSGSSPSTFPTSGSTNSQFSAGGTTGTAVWEADFGGLIHQVVFSITDVIPNGLIIVDSPGTGTAEIPDKTMIVGKSITGYAAAFFGATHWGDVSATWTLINNVGTNANTNPGSGTNSAFYSGSLGGTVTWQASYYEPVNGVWLNDTVNFTVEPPKIDIIRIVDAGYVEIQTQTVGVETTITGIAAGYNSTSGSFVQNVPAAWTVIPTAGEDADTSPANGTSSVFDSNTVGGSVTWQAEYGGMFDTVTVNINPPAVDDIEIVDSAGSGVALITDQTVGVGLLIRGYAAGFNTTLSQYVADVSVSWTATPSGFSNASTTPLSGTWSDIYTGFFGGSVVWEADYSGITDTVTFTIAPPVINYIEIVDTAGTGATEIPNFALNVQVERMGYAAGFNDTIGYVMDVDASWSVIPTGSEDAVSYPLTATWSNFLSGNVSGSVTWQASYSGLTDTVTVTINMIVLNYIDIVDTAGIGTTAIPDQAVDVGVTIIGHAAAFNYTIGYIGDVDATWTVTSSGSENATTTSPGTSADFWSGAIGGTVDWEAEFYGLTDTVTITINPPTVDYILIVDTADTGATEIPDQTVGINVPVTGYAASFNNSAGYMSDISVSWSVTPAASEDASTTPGSGESSAFNSGTVAGSVTWTADDLDDHTDTVVFTISTPTIDYIEIVDTAGVGTTTIVDQTVNVGVTFTGYAAGFNTTSGYVSDVSADWTVAPAGSEDASTDAGPAVTADFSSGTIGGSVDWKADYNGMTYTVTITINPPAVDSIKIMDAENNTGTEVTSLTMNDDETEDLYAAGFNATSGYVDDVAATWTTTLGSVNPVTGEMTTLTPAAGTGTLTATYNGLTASVPLTVSDVTGPVTPEQPEVEVSKDKVIVTFPPSPPSDYAEYQIQKMEEGTGTWVDVGPRQDPTTASYTDEDVEPGKTYNYRLVAYDDQGNPSNPSPTIQVKIPEKEEDDPWILILLFIIIAIVVILLLIFLMTRKKEEEEEMPPEEAPPEMPPEEAPPPEMPEEAMPPEEAELGAAPAAVPPPPGAAEEEAAPEAHNCPQCGGAMEYIEDYDQYYCYTCGKYDSEFEDEGGEEMPEGEGEPPAERSEGGEPPAEGPEGEAPSGEEPSGEEGPEGGEPPAEGGTEFQENPPEQ